MWALNIPQTNLFAMLGIKFRFQALFSWCTSLKNVYIYIWLYHNIYIKDKEFYSSVNRCFQDLESASITSLAALYKYTQWLIGKIAIYISQIFWNGKWSTDQENISTNMLSYQKIYISVSLPFWLVILPQLSQLAPSVAQRGELQDLSKPGEHLCHSMQPESLGS